MKWVVAGCILFAGLLGYRWSTATTLQEPLSPQPNESEYSMRELVELATISSSDSHSSSEKPACCVSPVLHRTAYRARGSQTLKLNGSLSLDPSRLVRVHSRFQGQVVAIGPRAQRPVTDSDESSEEPTLRFGDNVRAGQILAVVWSHEVGEKKSELLDALSKLFFDEASLQRLRGLDPGVVAEQTILKATRDFEADRIAVERAERTLRAWKLEESEIEGIRSEAQRLHRGERQRDLTTERSWAEVDVRAPQDGLILEKNVAVGDIVSTDRTLFQIGDVTRLMVIAAVYEEDLPKVEALPRGERHWEIQLRAEPRSPPIMGAFDMIGHVIDPEQHTGEVIGWVDNIDGRFRIGQFIAANIDLGPSPPAASPLEMARDE